MKHRSISKLLQHSILLCSSSWSPTCVERRAFRTSSSSTSEELFFCISQCSTSSNSAGQSDKRRNSFRDSPARSSSSRRDMLETSFTSSLAAAQKTRASFWTRLSSQSCWFWTGRPPGSSETPARSPPPRSQPVIWAPSPTQRTEQSQGPKLEPGGIVNAAGRHGRDQPDHRGDA